MDVTIFIRTKNEARRLPACLDQIRKQESPLAIETVVLDSGSADETVRIASEWGARVYAIPQHLFHFSRALNFGITVARGRFFVPISGHAVPVDKAWLHELLQPLIEDSNISAAYSRQLPWPEDSPATRRGVDHSFLERGYVLSAATFQDRCRRGEDPFNVAKFSNVSACIRTSDLCDRPFRALPFAEDRCFALEALLCGRSIAYASRSLVHHSHEPNFWSQMEVARRNTIARRSIDAAGLSALSIPESNLCVFQTLISATKVAAGVPWVVVSAFASPAYRAYVLGEFGIACGKFRASILPAPALPPPAPPYQIGTEATLVSQGD